VDEKDWVEPGQEILSIRELREAPDYDISISNSNENTHLMWVEAALGHYILHHGNDVSDRQIEQIISGLPKKRLVPIGKEAMSIGYGIHGVQGLSLFRLAIVFMTTAIPGLAFFAYWLKSHPYDIQNASVPYFMLTTAVWPLIAMADMYLK
jgi:hypothetical protein